jgi:hypothetical protein
MRILFDQGAPFPLRAFLTEHEKNNLPITAY